VGAGWRRPPAALVCQIGLPFRSRKTKVPVPGLISRTRIAATLKYRLDARDLDFIALVEANLIIFDGFGGRKVSFVNLVFDLHHQMRTIPGRCLGIPGPSRRAQCL